MEKEDKDTTEEKENKKAITWATFCHVGALSLYLGIPLGRESLNFQISMTIYALVAGLLAFALIGFLKFPDLIVVHVTFIIIAIVKTNKGENYRYPITIRIIK